VLAIFDAFRSATAPDQQLVERATAR
jgi:hypothetical protein